MKKVVLSTRAKLRYDELLDHLQREWSEEVKEAFIEKFERSLSVKSRYPKSSPATLKRKGVRRCVVTEQTTFFYRERKSTIEVIAIFDTREDPSDMNL